MNINISPLDYLLTYSIKPSIQRIAIMEYLMNHRIHPTVDDIYSALYASIPTLSKTTVYNTLWLFVKQNAVKSLVIDEKNVRFDIDTSHHAHFMCLDCGCVYDIPVENIEAMTLDGVGELTITETHLYYKGFCKKCLEKQEKEISN